MKRISVIFGTRPEAIKLAPLIHALKSSRRADCHVCVTAQHRQMLDQVLDVFGIVPDTDLDLMQPNQTLGALTSRAVAAIDRHLAESRPDIVLVQGDTTTVLCGALAAYYHRIPVGHVEAGLRTGNMNSPWPEEMNRVLTTRLARWHFAPTEANRRNLLNEGVPAANIHVTGNPVIDALMMALEKIRQAPPEIQGLPGNCLDALGYNRMVLVTGHRRESYGAGFENMCLAIVDLARRFPGVVFVYPVHLNPNVREPVQRILGTSAAPNIFLIEPQGYLPFVALMNRSSVILTDSGGVQEEAPSLGKPVLVMRETSERMEAVQAGTVRLVGTERQRIVEETTLILTNQAEYDARTLKVNPYGDGHATGRILDALGI